ncbi:MAG: hypothetical protein R3F59_30595 [Myxococcota bacterium]
MLDDLEALVHNARGASGPADAGRRGPQHARRRPGHARHRRRAGREAEETLAKADALLAKLDAAAEPLPETVAEARQALVDARAVIQRLNGSTTQLDAVLQNLEGFDVERIESILRDEGIRVRFSGRGDKP